MDADFQKKWNKVLELIRDNVGQSRFDVWFACAEPVEYDSAINKIVLRLPSKYYCDLYETSFYSLVSSALRKVFGNSISLEYSYAVIANDSKSEVKLESPQHSKVINNKITALNNSDPIQKQTSNFDPQLNSALNFENYCEGDSNKLAVTIAKYIAEHPGNPEFNPFFLHGNVGVGKTHLIQAIGIRIKERNPNAKVLFVPMKQFQTLYANAIIKKEVPQFINWFQQMDAILFDDLQELSNKPGTAEALFPVFNHLQQNRKNLVFTCDRPPIELDGISDRLIDRFKWGIVESLPNPDFCLRKKILEFKAKKNGLDLSEEIIDMIAAAVEGGSVREMESIVMRLYTRAIVKNAPITPELAREAMSQVVKQPERKSINFDMIVETTAEHFNLLPDAIYTRSRLRDIADARQVIMYLAHKLTNLSSPAIGNKLGRAHATVLHGIGAIKDRLSYNMEFATEISAIESDLMK